MARRTTDKTAAANKRFARTQPLRTYQTKGGAQQYGSPEAFEKADELAFERYLRAASDIPSNYQDMSKLSAIRNSLSAGIYSAPRSYGGQLSERLEDLAMEHTRDSFRRSKFKGTF